MGDFRRGSGVNACKTLARPKKTRSATRDSLASRFELPLLGSNQDSPDPESGVLPVTPRGTAHYILGPRRPGGLDGYADAQSARRLAAVRSEGPGKTALLSSGLQRQRLAYSP